MCAIERPLEALEASVNVIGFARGRVTLTEDLPDGSPEFTNLVAQFPCSCGQARMIARCQLLSLRHLLPHVTTL